MGYLAVLCVVALLSGCAVTITACPPGCNCDEPNKHVSCTGANITEVPKHIPVDTRSLDIGFTSITTVKRGDFFLLRFLKSLDLSDNKITTLERGAFEGLEGMTSLSLNNNRDFSLNDVDPTIFHDLRNLSYFYGQNNSLGAIPGALFRRNGRMLQLLLDHSGITELQPGCFANLTRLVMLDLSYNLIKTIGKDVFVGSWKLDSLFLGSNKLVHIDPGAFSTQSSLNFLLLDHNMLESIDGVLEGLNRMVSLSLVSNAIRVVKNGTFKDAVSLHSLDMSNNDLQDTQDALKDLGDLAQINLSNNRLTKVSLKGMPYLSDVWVNNNRLTSVPSDMSVLRQVFTMDISSNPIQDMTPSQFKDVGSLLKLDISNVSVVKDRGLGDDVLTGLDNLIELWLERNGLTAIPTKALCRVRQIQILNLNQNQINRTHEEDFACSRNLSKLQLANNVLTEIPEGLRSLPRLARLDVSRNPLVHIPNRSFTNLTSLTNLDLSNSEIELIDDQAFYGLSYMETLNLAGNKLGWLPSTVFNYTSFSEQLGLDGNPWDCDCQMYGLANDLHSARQKNLVNITCTAPETYKGKNLLDIPLPNFTCTCDRLAAPSVDLRGSDNQTKRGQSATLKCAVRACPVARLFWTTPRGMRLSPDVTDFTGYDVSADGTLVIASAVPEDSGNYSCTAGNYMGRDTQSHVLKVV